ncbi:MULTISPECIES: stage II sporulation protein P [Coprococcus]|jgi:stage II sporulation protein P|uniref:Stage II sporulation protein P n=1 Tax=Coprococcus comes TaxID=410072 RepID=A0A3E4GRZ0_9FIRM|nr:MULTISPECIES: stage II sporulation protein P [Coprococcus]MBN2911820.1 stage II sporulation protein P [Coprococcus sp.]RGJ24939.1 stage II sporulation protein P [Coprococcus comes]RGU45921.1 stage II sporulation protein P [Coprococcus comes]
MKKEQRICVLLAIMILGIWGLEAKSSGSLIPKSWKIRMIQSVQENAERLYMPGVTYTEKKQGEIRVTEAVVHMASALIPLGNYVTEREAAELLTEDEATYAILAKKQAEEENSVDENGQLIGKDKSEETRQASVPTMDLSMERLNDFEYLVSNFYTVDSVTYINPSELNASELLGKDLRIDLSTGGSKILIYHTHSQETFVDSDNDPSTSIVGIGRYLTEILNNKYKIPTMHHEGVYDLINGKLDRSEAYEFAKPEVEQILAENPSIEVVIDLHRDGVADTTHLVTEINGKPTAQIMFFNGLSRTRVNGDLVGMANPYLQDNLAFSLQMKIAAETKYPGFARRNYLRGYKYNMDLMPRMLLIEAGAQTNTVEEMRNAMEVLADLLNSVLTGR